jgi:hypothetical protein
MHTHACLCDKLELYFLCGCIFGSLGHLVTRLDGADKVCECTVTCIGVPSHHVLSLLRPAVDMRKRVFVPSHL